MLSPDAGRQIQNLEDLCSTRSHISVERNNRSRDNCDFKILPFKKHHKDNNYKEEDPGSTQTPRGQLPLKACVEQKLP